MTDKKEPLVITFTGDMPQNRKMVFQMGVAADTDVATINALLDKCRITFERQFAFGEIEIHKLELEQQEKQAVDHSKRLTVVEENVYRDWQTNGRRGELKLSHKQETEKQQAYANAEAIKDRIARVKKFIEACQAKMSG
jgi:hypothetical protein